MKCIETEDEPATTGKEEFLQLSCFISTDVKHMYFGLRNKMQEQITKMSSTLGRNATYTKTVSFLIVCVCVCINSHICTRFVLVFILERVIQYSKKKLLKY